MSVTLPPARHWAALPMFVLAVALVAVAGSLSSASTGSQYIALAKPTFAPSPWLFGPVWTILYCLIAVAGWLAWSARGWTPALGVYTAQLLLNAVWTPLFFTADQYGLAFADISLLWLLIVANVVLFWPIRRAAALLLLPYLLWVTYAAALNLAIWQLN
ncbi:TspO/MBR family protein [Nonomuraea dietziae]|uniref:Tryptophan-rich sensory protein n=1 Tax=Nonomuraea dietziae TaxID=65515 RepID=A0A7W5V1I9_9ACTN|nr:TspO/MBR family protein [Nonomuraea dietziae]MBB3725996.1 tryptophan-rich sensory protein [Nonomuraea dietziae]